MVISLSRRELRQQPERQLQPHVHALTDRDISKIFASEPVTKITSILMKCGWLPHEMGDDTRLFTLIHSLFTGLHLDHRTLDRDWIAIYELSARNLIDYGRIKEAVVLMEQILKVKEQTLANNHSSRRASQYVLAMAYQKNGQIREAISQLEQLFNIKEQTLAEHHPDRLTSQHALARVYRVNGQVREAVSLLEQVVNIQEQTLAEDHPDRLTSQHVLATIYWELDRRVAALQMMQHIVEIQRRVLDDHHPDRINSEDCVASRPRYGSYSQARILQLYKGS